VVTNVKQFTVYVLFSRRQRRESIMASHEDGCLLAIALMMEAARTSETLVNF
jgi:hypothetical protein